MTRCACGYFAGDHAAGICPGTKSAKFREPVPELRREWFGMQIPMTEVELAERVADVFDDVEVVESGRPQVAARPPAGPGELAGGSRTAAAIKLGRAAVSCGWQVEAAYWRAHSGNEGCALRLAKGPCRAVATWKRPAGNVGAESGWQSDTAYAWRSDAPGSLTKLTITQLGEIIT